MAASECFETFRDTLKGQPKEDINDATIFAQQSSQDKYRINNFATVDWYKSYVSVLQSVGFTGKPLPSFEKYTEGETFTMYDVVLHFLEDAATKEQSAVIEKASEAFKGLSDKRAALGLSGTDRDGDKISGSFHTIFCDQNPAGDTVNIVIGVFYFNNLKLLPSLFYSSSSGGSGEEVYGAVTTLLYTEQSYSQVRSYVAKQLHDRAAAMAAAVQL